MPPKQGRLPHQAAAAVGELVNPDHTYVSPWSDAGRTPVHIHYVVQTDHAAMDQHSAHGPHLQAGMFAAAVEPDPDLVEAFADRARAVFDRRTP